MVIQIVFEPIKSTELYQDNSHIIQFYTWAKKNSSQEVFKDDLLVEV
jgi:hypothetical protein